jgi:hypothetical protein
VSVTSPIPDVNGVAFTAAGKECFYCGQRLSDPAIFWMGFGADIYLHDSCVFELFIRLGRDCHEIRCPDLCARLRRNLS